MAIKAMEAPAGGRTRRSKYPFTPKEVEEAVKLLNDGKTPGVGPYASETEGQAIREARSAAQSLIRHIVSANPNLDGQLGSRAWEDANGDAFAVVRTKQS